MNINELIEKTQQLYRLCPEDKEYYESLLDVLFEYKEEWEYENHSDEIHGRFEIIDADDYFLQ